MDKAPDPREGGLGRFIREAIVAPLAEAKRRTAERRKSNKHGGRNPQSRGSKKKGGRGWLHN